MEKIIKPVSGFIALLISFLLAILSVYFFVTAVKEGPQSFVWYGIISLIVGLFLAAGIIIVSPNHSKVLTFFWKVCGHCQGERIAFCEPVV